MIHNEAAVYFQQCVQLVPLSVSPSYFHAEERVMFCLNETCCLQKVLFVRRGPCHYRPIATFTAGTVISVWRGPLNTEPNRYISVTDFATSPFHRDFSSLNGLLSARHHGLTIAANNFGGSRKACRTDFVSVRQYIMNYASFPRHIYEVLLKSNNRKTEK